MKMVPFERDWQLFREMLAGWQESYMESLIEEYKDFLNEDLPTSTKFWELDKKIKQDKKKPGVILEVDKRNMMIDIIRLLNDNVITMSDLSEFSDELKENVVFLQERMNNDF